MLRLFKDMKSLFPINRARELGLNDSSTDFYKVFLMSCLMLEGNLA
jgi:hypothetical protein